MAIGIDEVIDKKFEMMHCHESQVYEWLPYRRKLVERYGGAGRNMHFAGVCSVCKYGGELTEESAKEPFPS